MSKFTKEMVLDYADKLLIGLSDEEANMVLEEFDDIDKNIDQINNIKGIDKVTPMTCTLDDFNPTLREDVAVESDNIDDILSNADKVDGREVAVVKVVGGE
jgi:aspartyl/glutamyl-tRNA(Asn/Gln) amidotransferase C subunit